MAPCKAPKAVEFVDVIPRTAATKANRAAVAPADPARLDGRVMLWRCVFGG